jgi:hypothetical protein
MFLQHAPINPTEAVYLQRSAAKWTFNRLLSLGEHGIFTGLTPDFYTEFFWGEIVEFGIELH